MFNLLRRVCAIITSKIALSFETLIMYNKLPQHKKASWSYQTLIRRHQQKVKIKHTHLHRPKKTSMRHIPPPLRLPHVHPRPGACLEGLGRALRTRVGRVGRQDRRAWSGGRDGILSVCDVQRA